MKGEFREESRIELYKGMVKCIWWMCDLCMEPVAYVFGHFLHFAATSTFLVKPQISAN